MTISHRDETQNGLYRNMKTGKVVAVKAIYHDYPREGEIHVSFNGTRNDKTFGRTFGAPIEEFFNRHAKVV